MHSDQWQSYFLCQGQSPVYFRQDEREKLDWWTVHGHKRSLLLLLLLLLSPWIASFSESVDSEFILRDFTCSVSPALPAGTITSLSDYNLPPTVLPVHKKRKEKENTSWSPRLECHMYNPPPPPSPPLPPPPPTNLPPYHFSSGGFSATFAWIYGSTGWRWGHCPFFPSTMFSRRQLTGA